MLPALTKMARKWDYPGKSEWRSPFSKEEREGETLSLGNGGDTQGLGFFFPPVHWNSNCCLLAFCDFTSKLASLFFGGYNGIQCQPSHGWCRFWDPWASFGCWMTAEMYITSSKNLCHCETSVSGHSGEKSDKISSRKHVIANGGHGCSPQS